MGGNSWWQTGPYDPDLAVAFRRAQDEELAKGDHDDTGRTITELWESEDWLEYILTGGTGTVLDQVHTVAPDFTEGGPYMRPLTPEEVRAWCPDGRPTREQWTAALAADHELYPDRAQGNCTVLYEDGEPSEIGYWGVTAD